jgi:hypothetical protein
MAFDASSDLALRKQFDVMCSKMCTIWLTVHSLKPRIQVDSIKLCFSGAN